MMKLFVEGGPLFMGSLTLIGLVMITWSMVVGRRVFLPNGEDTQVLRHKLTYIRSIGVFALVTGILWQLTGLYQIFVAIEQLESVSPAILAGGLKVSSITTFYGVFIFLISYVVWFVLDFALSKETHD